jgi:hypothetical protein
MEIITPEAGLFVWSLISLLHLSLSVLSVIKLARNKSIEPAKKLVWVLGIIFVPFIGPLTYLALSKKIQSPVTRV